MFMGSSNPSLHETVAQVTGSRKSQEESSRIGKASFGDAYEYYGADGTVFVCSIPPKINVLIGKYH